MAIVAGIPGFSQLTKLNVIDQLRVNGTLISNPEDIIIRSVDDLPPASGGFHQLASSTVYDFRGKGVISPDGLKWGVDTLVRGDSPEITAFTYTGAGAAFSGTDVTIEAQSIFVNHPSGDLIDHDSPSGDHLVLFSRVNAVGLNIGSVGTQSAMVMDSSSLIGINEGLSYKAGSTSGLFLCDLSAFISLGPTSTALDFGDAVVSAIAMSVSNILGVNISMGGAAASANVGDEATVNGCKFTNTALSGITKKDLKWDFLGCSGVVSSTVYGAALMKSNLTSSPLPLNTPSPILGTFVEPSLAERVTTSAAGVMTVNNIQSQTGTIFVSLSMTKGGGGGTPTILISILKNGTAITDVEMSIDVTGNTAVASFIAPAEYIAGDTFQGYLENITNSTAMIVGDMQFILSSSGGL